MLFVPKISKYGLKISVIVRKVDFAIFSTNTFIPASMFIGFEKISHQFQTLEYIVVFLLNVGFALFITGFSAK